MGWRSELEEKVAEAEVDILQALKKKFTLPTEVDDVFFEYVSAVAQRLVVMEVSSELEKEDP